MAQHDFMRELSNTACIVGAAESDEMGILPHKSQMALHLESISNAVADAGLKVSDVDGIFTAGAHSPALIAEAQLRREPGLPALFVYNDGDPIDEARLAGFAWRLRSRPARRAPA